jgi:hypothetical protein
MAARQSASVQAIAIFVNFFNMIHLSSFGFLSRSIKRQDAFVRDRDEKSAKHVVCQARHVRLECASSDAKVVVGLAQSTAEA